MSFVLDASIALAWCFSDEKDSTSIALLEQLESETAFVPAIWSLELGNALLMAERKKRITYAQIIEFFAVLKKFNITVDHQTDNKAFHEIFTLAHAEGLTSYDASYLELSMRLCVPLATKDNQLAKAAKRLGLDVFK